MLRIASALRTLVAAGSLSALALLTPACGGGGNTHDSNPTGSMALISFLQAGITNSALNQVLEFRFSQPVDPDTLTAASLQVREGPAFGSTVAGVFETSGSTVFFKPQLPGLCDLSDTGFKPDTQYRVTLVGFPEDFTLRQDDGLVGQSTGDPLTGTLNFEFRTRLGDDPLLFTDQIPAASPTVIATTPSDTTAAVAVLQGNQVVIQLSENVNPCTVDGTTVLFDEYQRGDIGVNNVDPISGRNTGFTPTADADVSPFSWGPLNGLEVAVSPAQRIRNQVTLSQSFTGTTITITPELGQFPENALCVVQLTFGIKDFGGQSLTPYVFSFTTENLPVQSGSYRVGFEGETPILKDQSTADVDTLRSPDKAQGWLLFAGDADNGTNQLIPTLPETNNPTCTLPRQINDGNKDDFDPNADVNFDTGLTVNACPNKTDGSTAVVWEFRTFRIRAGRTVRFTGVNPAIILVQGDVVIESGARLLAKGDGANGTQTANGSAGQANSTFDPGGGAGSAGGGRGGNTYRPGHSSLKGDDGRTGFGSPSGANVLAGIGTGLGGSHATIGTFTASGSGYGGGGGGHSDLGMDGASGMNGAATYKTSSLPTGGGTYPAMDDRLLTPSAGSGGGGAGYGDLTSSTFAGYDASGGAGGAGGGFVDLTSGGNINVFGTIDASGGRGGNGAAGFYMAGGGGGGGSGGGIRLLTPNSINIQGGTLTAAAGAGGTGSLTTGGTGPRNDGGSGAKGRLVMEDGDSQILGIGGATLSPIEGDTGFNRGVFDASRFKGGGLEPQLVTDVFLVGPTNPSFVVPVVADFIASIPAGSERGLNLTSILIEARGFQMKPDGTPDLTVFTNTLPNWRTVGYFRHSGVASAPTWITGANPGDVAIPPGNAGPAITNLNGAEFLQLRITMYLPNTIGPFDPGPILDDWTIRYTANQ